MYHKKIKINGTEYPLAANIVGNGAPTTKTEALVGMLYMDEATGDFYKCVAVNDEGYVWESALAKLEAWKNEVLGADEAIKASAEAARDGAIAAAESAQASATAAKTDTATVKKQVTKNTQDINILKAVSEGKLYEADENFPSCDGSGGFLYTESSKILPTAYVTNLIMGEDQEGVSHIAVFAGMCDIDAIMVNAEIPENIRELLKDWKIIDDDKLSRRGWSLTDFDLENKIKRQTWYGESFDEIFPRMEFEPVTDDMLPDDVRSQVEERREWGSCEVFRMKHSESGVYITVSDHTEDSYGDEEPYYVSYKGYFLTSSESDMRFRIYENMPFIDFWVEEPIEAEPIEVNIDLYHYEQAVNMDYTLHEVQSALLTADIEKGLDAVGYDGWDEWITEHSSGNAEYECDECLEFGTQYTNRSVIKAYVKL